MTTDTEKALPKYRQVKETIIQYFTEEQYKPDQRIPSENELVERFQVSRNTIRQALAELNDEGLIYKKQGLGTFFSGNFTAPRQLSHLVGVLSPRISYYIYPQIMEAIDKVAHQNRYNIVLGNSYADYAKELTCLEQLLERQIDGLLFEPVGGFQKLEETQIFHALNALTIPFVLMNWWFPNPDISCVSVDDLEGGLRATQYLIDAGHRRIACLYPYDKLPGMHRYQGYRKALEQAGIQPEPRLEKAVTSLQWDEPETIPRVVRELLVLNNSERPTAIFCFNDDSALRAMATLRDANVAVPSDISLIGFDNADQSAAADVPLTTLHHPKHLIGKWAAEILFDQIADAKHRSPRKVLITPTIIERDSVSARRVAS